MLAFVFLMQMFYSQQVGRVLYDVSRLRDRPSDNNLFHLGRVFRKKINANLRLKVNRSIKLFLIAYVLCSLSLVKLKTGGQLGTV